MKSRPRITLLAVALAGIWRHIRNTRIGRGTAMAYSTLAMAPTLVVFLLAQRFIVSGLASAPVE